MIGMMLIGIPIAVSMALVGIVGGIAAYGVPFMDSIAPVVWGVQNENLLTSIPLFVLLGELLLRSGIADRMYIALSAWLGRLPGGLLHTNIGSCALFAATSGSSVATAATVGTVALPSLMKRGYSMRASLGSLAAGGTLGILIPPSVNMIVYGSLTNNSIGKLFIAGIIPGLLLTLCFMLWIWISSVASGNVMREEKVPLAERLRTLKFLVPPLVVFGIVMGSLYFGIATTTESAALGVIAALLFVLAIGQAEPGAAAHLLRLDGARQRHDPADHHGRVHPEPDDQPDRRGRGDDEVGRRPGPVGHRPDPGADRVLPDPGHVHGRAVDAGGHHPDHLPDRHRARRRPDLVRHLHRADVRAGPDHAAGGHEPLRRARHPARQGRPRRRDLGRAALCGRS